MLLNSTAEAVLAITISIVGKSSRIRTYCLSGNIGNTISSDLLYKGLIILLDWSLSRLAPDGLIIVSIF